MMLEERNQSTKSVLSASILFIAAGVGLISCRTANNPARPNLAASTPTNPEWQQPNGFTSTAAPLESNAIREMEAAVQAKPSDRKLRRDLAEALLADNQLVRAAAEFTTLVRLDPADLEAHIKLAGIELTTKDFTSAEKHYRFVTERSPKNSVAWQGLCAALIKQRRFFEATAAADRAMKLTPKDVGSRLLHATAMLNFALQFSDPRGHSAEIHLAQKELQQLTKEIPNSAELYFQLGRAAQSLYHREESVRCLELAHTYQPHSAEIARSLAISYRAMNRDDLALKLMRDMATITPDSPAINDLLGQLLVASPEPTARQQALTAFSRAFKAAPNDSGLCERLGSAFEKVQDLENARKAYERATQLNPYHAFAFQKLALIYTRLGKPELAKQAADYGQKMAFNEQQLKTILELSSKHPDDVNLHLIIAERYNEMHMAGPSREEYYVAKGLDPSNPRIPRKLPTESSTMPLKR